MKPKVIVLPGAEFPRAKMVRLYECTCEPTSGGWVARCEETGLSAFGFTADGATGRLIRKNASVANN
jgi:hypothetical protein